MNIELCLPKDFEEENFIGENQIVFGKAAGEEFGPQRESMIPREDIISSIHADLLWRIRCVRGAPQRRLMFICSCHFAISICGGDSDGQDGVAAYRCRGIDGHMEIVV